MELKQNYLDLCKRYDEEKEEIEIIDVFRSLYDVDDSKLIDIAWLFRRLSTKYIKLYPKVKWLLKKLKKTGYKTYILSNAQEAFTMPELIKLKLSTYFDGIMISSYYGIKKPNPEIFRLALKNFHLTDAVMIGNEYSCDIEPAKKLGLKTIYIESNLTFERKEEPDFRKLNAKRLYQAIIRLY
ncbi:MAG: HAD family hydrolase, partial [Anaeroplasmataceae bacterium]|nr:HAD family hydrolase [Anaeroplasmataceae bacterium]